MADEIFMASEESILDLDLVESMDVDLREGAGQLKFLHNVTMDLTGDDHQITEQTSNIGGEFQLESSLVPSSSTPPEAAWNAALSTVFGVQTIAAKAKPPWGSKAIAQKRAAIEKKEKDEAAKLERKEKALQKKS